MFDLTFNPTTITEIGSYTVHYLVTETGIGPCDYIPHVRKYSILVKKRPPTINYVIPDYTNFRAGVPYEIVFAAAP
jgi:hypothetical protein